MKRVLIAEDNPILCDIFTSTFDEHHFEVTFVKDGHDTLYSLKQNPPDILILNINVSCFCECDVLACVRSYQSRHNMQVIVISGNSLAMQEQTTGQPGLFLVKPVNLPDLLDLASQLID